MLTLRELAMAFASRSGPLREHPKATTGGSEVGAICADDTQGTPPQLDSESQEFLNRATPEMSLARISRLRNRQQLRVFRDRVQKLRECVNCEAVLAT
jgi:hypothetical protein